MFLGTLVNAPLPSYGCIPDQNMREAEGWDRANVSLPGLQLQLLQAVANASTARGGSVVLIIENGEAGRAEWSQGGWGGGAGPRKLRDVPPVLLERPRTVCV